MDGESTDRTCEIVKSFTEEYDEIKLISQKDSGGYDAMNKGIRESKGDYLYFMGSDDVFYQDSTLDSLVNSIDAKSDFIDGNVLFKHSNQVYSGESSLQRLVYDQISICHQAIVYSRRAFEELGDYDLNFFVHADYDFNIRCFKSEKIVTQYVDQIIAVFNEKGISGNYSNKDGFHTQLTHENIREKEDVIALYYENKELKDRISKIKQSRNYKFGSLLLKPFRYIKKLFT